MDMKIICIINQINEIISLNHHSTIFLDSYIQIKMKNKRISIKFKSIPSTCTRREKLDKFISGHIQESIEINTTETELLKCSLLWHSLCCYLWFNIRLKNQSNSSFKFNNAKLTVEEEEWIEEKEKEIGLGFSPWLQWNLLDLVLARGCFSPLKDAVRVLLPLLWTLKETLLYQL